MGAGREVKAASPVSADVPKERRRVSCELHFVMFGLLLIGDVTGRTGMRGVMGVARSNRDWRRGLA